MNTSNTIHESGGHDERQNQHHKLHVTVLYNGKDKKHTFSAHDSTEKVIVELLPHDYKHEPEKFMLVDARPEVGELKSNRTLHESGVQDHDVLSLNRRHGGGG